jgi:hypothetical protein
MLRDRPALRVLVATLGWVILVLVFAIPRVLRLLSGGAVDGGDAGLSFGPKAMFLVLLVTVLPPLALVAIWLWQRGRSGKG